MKHIEEIFKTKATRSDSGDAAPEPSDVAGVRAGAREGCPDDADVPTHVGVRGRCGYPRCDARGGLEPPGQPIGPPVAAGAAPRRPLRRGAERHRISSGRVRARF